MAHTIIISMLMFTGSFPYVCTWLCDTGSLLHTSKGTLMCGDSVPVSQLKK